MYTISLKVNEKVYDKLISLLGKFSKQEVEIIENDIFLEETKEYLDKELKEIKSGRAKFLSKDEVNSSLENIISKHENKI